MAKEQRGGQVFVDWSQNDRHKTTVVRVLAARHRRPAVSTPVRGTRSTSSPTAGDPGAFAFTPADVLARVDELGDLYADSLAGDQELPELG